MTERKLHEGKVWMAEFSRTPGGNDGYHVILVMADSLAEAQATLFIVPPTDCVLTSIKQMETVRGIIA